MLIDLEENDSLAECLRKFLTIRLISLLQIKGEVKNLTSVSNRDCDIFPSVTLCLVNILDERINLGDHRIHPAVINLIHMLYEASLKIFTLSLSIESLIESRIDRKLRHKIVGEIVVIHALGIVHDNLCSIYHHIHDVDFDSLSGNRVTSSGIDSLTLIVHHVIVLEQSLTDTEVVFLDLALSLLDTVRQHLALECILLSHTEFIHCSSDLVRTEKTHQLILERYIECRRTRVSLTSGTTSQLTVHTTAVMSLSTDDGKTALRLHLRRKLDIGSSTCHIRGDGDST